MILDVCTYGRTNKRNLCFQLSCGELLQKEGFIVTYNYEVPHLGCLGDKRGDNTTAGENNHFLRLVIKQLIQDFGTQPRHTLKRKK